MITYNHAEHLAQAIEGVVTQVCKFPFELIIGEDASADATLQIATEYQKRYPEIIRVVYSSSNVGMNSNSLRIFARARGQYVAYCEGDDFWCDSDKLAKQVALMKSDPGIGIVHTDWARSRLKDGRWSHDLRKSVHRRTASRYLQGNLFSTWHSPKVLRTCTILLRRTTMVEWYDSGIMNENYHFGDSVLAAWITSRWKAGYIPAVMAVYHVSPNSALRSGARSRVAFYRSALEFDTAARTFFASRVDYPSGYRWESAAGLLLWGARARDAQAIKDALLDFTRNFTLAGFLEAGLKAVVMRLPSVRRQQREIPSDATNGAVQP
ncbi:glycosyltransferase family 2 protein [Luteimonas changyuni]|uniref:glycosyltransferase family 2 protein n=1 Tax=Luteimonas sp. MJ145 TaxID=3129234 RepID=UPI0031BBAB78